MTIHPVQTLKAPILPVHPAVAILILQRPLGNTDDPSLRQQMGMSFQYGCCAWMQCFDTDFDIHSCPPPRPRLSPPGADHKQPGQLPELPLQGICSVVYALAFCLMY